VRSVTYERDQGTAREVPCKRMSMERASLLEVICIVTLAESDRKEMRDARRGANSQTQMGNVFRCLSCAVEKRSPQFVSASSGETRLALQVRC
jgi:hypothetical protein